MLELGVSFILGFLSETMARDHPIIMEKDDFPMGCSIKK